MRLDVVQVLLPMALAVIMCYLGMTLVLDDFRQVVRRPKALLVGLAGQILLVPMLAFLIAKLSGLDPVMAVGLMVLGACPGGVSSALLTHMARGDTALSITLTAVTSLASVITLPLVVGVSYHHFMASELAVQLPMAAMVRGVFLLTTVPVLLGMTLRWRYPRWVGRFEPFGARLTTALFILIILTTFWDQRQVLTDHLAHLGATLLGLNALILALAYGMAVATHMARRDRIAVVTECGLQNSALGIYICLQWLATPAMSAPSVVYALVMNAGALAFAFWMRKTETA